MKPVEIQSKDLVRGDTFNELFIFNNSDGTPYNLTVFTDIVMDIRKGTSSNTELVTSLKLLNGVTITGVNNNQLEISISSTLTKGMKGGVYYRDIRFVKGVEVSTILFGKIMVYENITTVVIP